MDILAWKHWKTPLAGLPNISFIIKKPKLLGESRIMRNLGFLSELH
jgi:hypothetical protein